MNDRLAGDAEPEVPRLDDPCVHGADGNLKNPLAFHMLEVERPPDTGNGRLGIEVLQHRVHVLGPVRV